MDTLSKNSYYNIITSQHRTKPNYMKFIEAITNVLFDYADLLSTFDYKFDIDFAEGEQLDFIGKTIGIGREVNFVLEDGTNKLLDEDYRIAIKSKIAQNHWDGTIEGLKNIWYQVFPDIPIVIKDNMDMSAVISVKSALTGNQIKMLFAGVLIPRPMGVQYSYVFGDKAIFSFDLDTDMFKGYDEGYWLSDI